MEEIEDITIQEYFNMKDSSQYDVFVDCMNPVNSFAGKQCDVSKLTYDEVEVIKMIFSNPTMEDVMELIIMCFGLRGDRNQSSVDQYLSTSVFDLFRANQFLQNYIKKVVDKEVLWFTGKDDDKLKMINAKERLKSVSHLLTKISLAEQFSVQETDIGGWKYSRVFTILVANKIKQDLTEEYNEIK